ncbi:FAD-dependent oxidoreductase [Haliovirga abyssi]|uniref:FAD/NAD(P)-binding domain-containing protein n=1 Tax=Haliovirga abyssi TaxID=2996794 RepID=A0AAU9E0R2_9FUSO|nr:FAD-dependent oxidoreductase [Haliovirga abyssi]BDU51515.1 hypothetical protein HLVA_20840 [Haliovirga abyssi]
MDLNLNLDGFDIENNGNTKNLDENKIYELLIIGGGPSAMTAAVYAMRKGIDTGIITYKFGGQILETEAIENYMGFMYIKGEDLVNKFKNQIDQFPIGYKSGFEVTKTKLKKDIKEIYVSDGTKYKAKTVIIAAGSKWRKLNIPGESEFSGKGIAYCTTCDAPFYKNKKVAVIGGGNAGIEAAIDLASIAKEVTLIEYLPKLNGDKILIDKLNNFSNVKIMTNHQILEAIGNKKLEKAKFKNRETNKIFDIELDGIFVEIGLIPNSQIFKDEIKLNSKNEISIDCSCKTSLPGVFASGDITSVPYNQVIIAAGEGAKAALSVYSYLINK